jgi:hypothetical protein
VHGYGLVKAPPGYHSTHAYGKSGPAEDGNVDMFFGQTAKLHDGPVVLATSKPVMRTDPKFQSSSFSNDEFVVYDESQVNLRYVVRLKM